MEKMGQSALIRLPRKRKKRQKSPNSVATCSAAGELMQVISVYKTLVALGRSGENQKMLPLPRVGPCRKGNQNGVEAAERANARDRVRCAQAMWGAAIQSAGFDWIRLRNGPGGRSIGQLAGPWRCRGFAEHHPHCFSSSPLSSPAWRVKGGRCVAIWIWATDLPSCSPREFTPFSVTLAWTPSTFRGGAERWTGIFLLAFSPFCCWVRHGESGARECLG